MIDMEKRRLRYQRYNQSKEGIAAKMRYEYGEKGIATRRRYRNSEEGKESHRLADRKYRLSEKGKERRKRYFLSEEGKATREAGRRRFYIRHPNYYTEYGTAHYNAARERSRKWRIAHPHYFKERYYRLQERFGYHGNPNEVLQTLKFIEAFRLGNYKVVKS